MPTGYSLPADAVWFGKSFPSSVPLFSPLLRSKIDANVHLSQVTGSSSGIGRAFATHISKSPSPYRLVATARNASSLDYLPNTPNILKLTLDITSASTIQDAITRTISHFGRIDIVINNAGYSLVGDTESTTDEQSRAQFETNFWGAANLTREAVRVMREDNPKNGQMGGVVIYTSAASARATFPGGAYYFASRFAMDGFLSSFSQELDPAWNIHLTSALPGGVKTDYFQKSVIFTDRHPAYSDPNLPTSQMQAMFTTPGIADMFPEPEKLVEVIVGMVKDGIGELGIPLRLPLAADAWGMVKGAEERVLKELEAVKEVSMRVKPDERGMGLLKDLA
ncbi:hypothetical protein OHC33_005009 [Knufia fluminis]|uniref:Uncharacterized protein n=1 Tax=Knufia fluminis TaxID=191047 RepID=A0AAN8EGS1_9EURO|nr:hypothetical protein OHC33_005009 [Knufia fluminis]